jgi:CheY-like chemotaxis protein
MPKMDGFTLLEKIRENSPSIKTIIISGFVEGLENKIKGLNVDAVLKKPVQFEELERQILKALQVTKEEILDKIPPGSRPADIRVLVVDDENDITDFFQEVLPDYGFLGEIVRSGEEGVMKAQKTQYDMLITDVSMGDMSGLEMVKQMTASKHAPYSIAVYSANLTSPLMEEFRRLGVTKFLHKPATLQELIDWLESQVPVIVKKRQAAQ